MTDTKTEPNYQDILDKYADSIKPAQAATLQAQPELETTQEPEPLLEAELTPESKLKINPEPEFDTPVDSEPQPEPILESKPEPETEFQPEIEKQPEVETQPQSELASEQLNLTAPPAPEAITTPETPMELAPESSDLAPPKENHFFKYLFFFSLFVFIIVLVSIIFSFINSQKSLSDTNNPPTSSPPTLAPVGVCEVNGQAYTVGESFPATDGCNSCSCDENLQIACTAMSCEPTKSATTSANTKNYSNSAFAFSFYYPKDLTVVDLLPKQFTKISTTREYLLLEDKNKTFAITLMVNPDGFGPIFSNKDYTLKYQLEKGLISTIKTTNTPDENFDKINDVYLYSGEINKDFNLLIMVRSSKGLTTSDQTISQILSTFKLTTPTATTAPKATITP